MVTGSVQSADLSRQNQDVPRVAGSHSTRKRQRRLRRRNRKRKRRGLTKLPKRTTTGETGKNIVTLFFLAIFTILPKHGRLGKLDHSQLTKIFTSKTEYGG